MKKKTFLSQSCQAILALFFLLVVAGCGSSDGVTNDFVFTGNNGGTTAGAGAVTFNFVMAQEAAPLPVPDDTVTIDFQFFSEINGNGVLLQSESRNFASTITIDPVVASSKSVAVTARTADNYPTLESVEPIDVIPGETIIVDFGGNNFEPVTIDNFFVTPSGANVDSGQTVQLTASLEFSNGEILPANEVTWTATGQATVDDNGLVTALTDGIATIEANRDGAISQSTITVGVGQVLTTITVSPDSPSLSVDDTATFTADVVDQNGAPFPSTGVEWSVTAGSGDGNIDVSSGLFTATAPGTVTVLATEGNVSGQTTVTIAGPMPEMLSTTFAGGNGCNGNMFDVTTGAAPIRIDSFDVHVSATTTEPVDVYYKLGTFSGFETNAGAWTLLGTATVTGAGEGNPTALPVGGLTIPAGTTYGIYIDRPAGSFTYSNGTTTFNDANITIENGTGMCSTFFGTNSGRVWNGTLFYTLNP